MATAWTKGRVSGPGAEGDKGRLQVLGGISDGATVSRTPKEKSETARPALVTVRQPARRLGEAV
jgi:hypothetical protein